MLVLGLRFEMRPWNDPLGWPQAEQCDVIPSIIQERLIEHSSPAGTMGMQQRTKEAKIPPLKELTFSGRECTNGPTGSRPDGEEAMAS